MASATASRTCSVHDAGAVPLAVAGSAAEPGRTKSGSISARAAVSSGSVIRIIRNNSFSPQRMASTRWLGALASGSDQSK